VVCVVVERLDHQGMVGLRSGVGLLTISVVCGGACALACYVVPRPLVVVGPVAFPRVLIVVGPVAAWMARQIWREGR